jgi:hypothetical protein
MTTKIKHQLLSINWSYSDPTADVFLAPRRTTCYMKALLPDGTNKTIASATISLYYKDHFEYEKARKASLRHLLHDVWPEKENKTEREEIWKTYFARKAKKVKA